VFTGVIGGLLCAVLLAGATRWGSLTSLTGPVAEGGWTGRTRGWFTARGFFSPETDQNADTHYSWTGDTARLSIAHLDRSQPYQLKLDLSAGRPPEIAPPSVEFLVDGRPAGSFQTTNDTRTATVAIPSQAGDRAVVTMRVSQTFKPASADARTLGVIVRHLVLTPGSGHFSPSWSALMNVGLGAALAVAGVLLCGLSGALGAGVAAPIIAGFAWLALQDGAFIGTYTESLLNLGMAVGLIGTVVAAVRSRWLSIAGLPDWAPAIGLIAGITLVKLAVFNHPLATIGDGIFQLHRAQAVRSGSYFFTSITPRPFFEFPYAIGLYVTALPFWSYFPTDLDQVRLLRGVALGADALVGLACYAFAYRQWRDRQMALLVAGLWPFARAPLEALCNANLTNVFAQGMFGVGMGLFAWMAACGASATPVTLSLCFVAAGFLSHFGTFSVGVPLVTATAVVVFAGGRGGVRRTGLWMLGIGAAAAVIAYVAYYSHFTDVYRATWARIVSREAVDVATTGSAIAASPATKFQRWFAGTSDDYGLPGLALAIASLVGLILILKERPREGVTLVLVGWLAVWAGFSALGILSPIQMRVNLAAAPVFVCLGAYALGTIARHSAVGRLISASAGVAIAFSGARLWLMCLGR
jgi:hypothetical protein